MRDPHLVGSIKGIRQVSRTAFNFMKIAQDRLSIFSGSVLFMNKRFLITFPLD